jgi:hypothetical protein
MISTENCWANFLVVHWSSLIITLHETRTEFYKYFQKLWILQKLLAMRNVDIVKICNFYLKYVFVWNMYYKIQWEIYDYMHCDISSVIIFLVVDLCL